MRTHKIHKVGKKARKLGFTKRMRRYKYHPVTGKAKRTRDVFW